MTDTIIFPARPSMVRVARYAARVILGEGPRIREALQIISELATNAILHSASRDGGTFELGITVTDGLVRIEVADAGSASTPGRTEDTNDYGRGLLIVEQLADKWGTDSHENGDTWWAELSWS